MSRASSVSAGEVLDKGGKANHVARPIDAAVNGSNRSFGLDGAGDGYDYPRRRYSRSPSPYRHRRTRSPSPYRHNRKADRSPSPFRHNRDSNGSRSYHKRKASPPRGGRPDKRFHAERDGRGVLPAPGSDNVRNGLPDRANTKPISYAEVAHPSPVPEFQFGLPVPSRANKSDTRKAQRMSAHDTEQKRGKDTRDALAAKSASQSSANRDTEMTNTEDISDDIPAPLEEKVPTEESREQKRLRWARIRAAANNSVSAITTPDIGNSPASSFASPRNGELESAPASPDVMIIDKQEASTQGNTPAADSPSDAIHSSGQDALHVAEPAASKPNVSEILSGAHDETDPEQRSTLPGEKVEVIEAQEYDMFAEDDNIEYVKEPVQQKGKVLDERAMANWNDHEGYYNLIPNELVNKGRYRMIQSLGRGVFANVAQAEEIITEDTSRLVAIKMIRKNEMMVVASKKEMKVLRKLIEADEDDKNHIVRLLDHFYHKEHLCIVFEQMYKNLRDLLKDETRGHGLSFAAVREYSRQMLVGLQHLKDCQIIHLDLKPDNVLVSHDLKTIKLADFGTAVDQRDPIERSKYIVSRFYRAPEIILGMAISYPVDMWAIGCTIYEIWTGKILFSGISNNQMMKVFMDCLGWPSEKLLRKGLADNVLDYFELGAPLKFRSIEMDELTKKPIVRIIEQQKKVERDLKSRVHQAADRITAGGPTRLELNTFAEFLGFALHMNVDRRLTPKEALDHKFIKGQPAPPKTAAPKKLAPPLSKPSLLRHAIPAARK